MLEVDSDMLGRRLARHAFSSPAELLDKQSFPLASPPADSLAPTERAEDQLRLPALALPGEGLGGDSTFTARRSG